MTREEREKEQARRAAGWRSEADMLADERCWDEIEMGHGEQPAMELAPSGLRHRGRHGASRAAEQVPVRYYRSSTGIMVQDKRRVR